MPVFRYTAATSGERSSLTSGELTADSAVQVRQALRRAGLTPVRVAPSRVRSRWGRLRGGRLAREPGHDAEQQAERGSQPDVEQEASRSRRSIRRSARGDVVELYESLSALLASGLPLAGALETVAKAQTTARQAALGTLCRELAEALARGDSLAGAMADRPEWFRDIDRALVRAAEESGELERALCDLAEHHARGEELRGRLAAALSYPALLCLFGLGVVVFLSTTTLPPLVATLTDAGVEPPGATKVLMALGAAIARWWWLIAGAAVAVIVIARRSSLGAIISGQLLRAPLLGAALARAELGSACVMLARLLDGGVPLTDALALTGPTVRNAALRAAFDGLRSRLIEGRSLRADEESAARKGRDRDLGQGSDWGRAGASSGGGGGGADLPEDILRVLEVGRESGELPRALRTLGERRLRSARRLIDRLAAVLEPAVIVLLAALVGLVVYAAIAPMLRLAQTL